MGSGAEIGRTGVAGRTGVEGACCDADTGPLGRNRGVGMGLSVAAERGGGMGAGRVVTEAACAVAEVELFAEDAPRSLGV